MNTMLDPLIGLKIAIDNPNFLTQKKIWNGRKYKILQYHHCLLKDFEILRLEDKVMMNKKTATSFQRYINLRRRNKNKLKIESCNNCKIGKFIRMSLETWECNNCQGVIKI